MIVANAMTDRRSQAPVPTKSRRRCYCGCERRATHMGLANGVVMMTGCELSVLRWVKSPRDALRAAIRIDNRQKLHAQMKSEAMSGQPRG